MNDNNNRSSFTEAKNRFTLPNRNEKFRFSITATTL